MARSDSTRKFGACARHLGLAVSLLAMLALALGLSATAARADGDPASDVLATQSLFLPQDAGIPARQQAQLAALLQSARSRGYPIRVALIASAADLGSITQLWRQPQTYAGFLGQELSLIYRGPLLVAMPNGFGFNGFSRPLAAERAALAGIRPATGGAALGAAALTAVERLAAQSGHPLPHPSATTQSSSGTPADPTPWIVVALGAAVVAAAWAASLRARPLTARGRKATST